MTAGIEIGALCSGGFRDLVDRRLCVSWRRRPLPSSG